MYVGQAFLWALAIALIGGFLNLTIRSNRNGSGVAASIIGGVVTFAVNWFVIWAILWWVLPPHTGTLGGYGWLWMPLTVALVIFGLSDGLSSGVGAGTVVTGVAWVGITAIAVIFAIPTCSTGDQNHLANLVQVEHAPPDAGNVKH